MLGNKFAVGNDAPKSEEQKRLISESNKETWRSRSPEDNDERIRRALLGNQGRPTEPEAVVWGWLDTNRPNDWRYNGDGREGVVIGGKVPDFINVNGQKAVIEVFVEYWHGEDEVQPKIEHYAKYGFKCIVLWDYECYLDEDIRKKVSALYE